MEPVDQENAIQAILPPEAATLIFERFNKR